MGARGPKRGQTDLQHLVLQLAQEREYQHSDGTPNRVQIARAIGCTRQAVQHVFVRHLVRSSSAGLVFISQE